MELRTIGLRCIWYPFRVSKCIWVLGVYGALFVFAGVYGALSVFYGVVCPVCGVIGFTWASPVKVPGRHIH